jgi:hypothetical protein
MTGNSRNRLHNPAVCMRCLDTVDSNLVLQTGASRLYEDDQLKDNEMGGTCGMQ